MDMVKLSVHVLALVAVFSFTASVYADDGVKGIIAPSSGKIVHLRVDRGTAPSIPAEVLPDGLPTPMPENILGPVPEYGGVDPVTAAQEFLASYGNAFGAKNPVQELQIYKEETDELGMSHVRFKQVSGRIPVFGAEVVVHVDSAGNVISANGNVAKLPPLTTARAPRDRVNEMMARAIALRAFREAHPKVRGWVRESGMQILQPSVYQENGDTQVYRTWDVRVAAEMVADEEYFVDAATGRILFTLDNVRRAVGVYDCSSKPGTDLCSINVPIHYINQWLNWDAPPMDYTFGCSVNNPCPRGDNPRYLPENSLDTDNSYTYLNHAHDYYQTKFNRNGANGQGGNTNGSLYPLDRDLGWTYLNWLSSWADDCLGAEYWSNMGVGFCKGLVVPDIVGHEYAHGLNAGHLTYSGQSGALEENYADVAGEMFEYYETGSSDWLSGADRSLIDPPSLISWVTNGPYPDRFTSSNVYCGSNDSSGVHHNTTIPSKAAYLMTMGDTFNGCTISGIGRDKVEQIQYHLKTQIYSSSENFAQAYNDTIQACVDLYGAGSNDCTQVARALQAVEMDQVGYCSDPNHQQTHPATCQCTDLDDWRGDGNYQTHGGVQGTVSYNGHNYTDYCVMRRNVIEQFCDKGVRRQARIYCPNGCSNGACL
jgi:bacillolysin